MTTKCKIREALNLACKELAHRELACKERVRLVSELLLCHVLGLQRVCLHARDEEALSEEQFAAFWALVERAARDEPLEYLIGKVGFYGYEWEICAGVLIPRPETEILVERAGDLIASQGITEVFELGVGSGVISLTLALLHPHLRIIASDINPQALALTQRNMQRFRSLDASLRERITLTSDNILETSSRLLQGSELLISNPPYISRSYALPANVAYEPSEALFGGEGGEEILCALIQVAQEHGIPFLACEMGWDQRVKMEARLAGFERVEFYKDWAGLDRGFIAKL